MLGLATFGGPHLLILDEPTNHLDIDSRTALIEAINDYPGAVILVSHDRHLLDACADRLWLVADGKVTTFDGDLDDYRRRVLSDRDDSDRNSRAKSRRKTTAQLRSSQGQPRPSAKPLRQRVSARRQRSPASPARSRSSMRLWPMAVCFCAIPQRRLRSPSRAPKTPPRLRKPKRIGSPPASRLKTATN